MDRLTEEADKQEDLTFLEYQRNLRKMIVGERDLDYDESVNDKEVRKGRPSRMAAVGSITK